MRRRERGLMRMTERRRKREEKREQIAPGSEGREIIYET
jgi:hypothetical protein